MEKGSDYYQLLKHAIEHECLVTKTTEPDLFRYQTKISWLFDLRMIMLKSTTLNAFSELFWERYKNAPSFQICGIEMAAVPLLAAIIMKFHEKGRPLNGFIIRKSRKKTGLLKMVEGEVTDDPIIIIDDLINSGASVTRQIEVIKDLNKEVREVFTILRFRDIEYYTSLKKQNIPLYSIFELNDLKGSLVAMNIPDPKQEKQTEDPFESRPIWFFKGEHPNFFHVVPKSAPVISDDMVFFGTDDGTFFARDRETGSAVWKYKVLFGNAGKFIFSTPAIHKNLVFFGAYDGNLYALDKRTGKRAWVFMEADWIGSSPAVADDLGMVFIGLEFGLLSKQGAIVGINAMSGDKVWEHRVPRLTHGSPAYSKRFQVVACGSNDGVLYALNAKTGKLLWNFQTEGAIKYAPSFSDKHGFVVILGHGNTVYVLETKTGKVVSRYNMDLGGYSTPLIVGDTVICTSFDKHVHCFNIFTGALLWKYDTGARCFSTPILAEGKIYVGSNNGMLFELDPLHGSVSGIFQTRERIVNSIAYDTKTKLFLIPTFANEVFALKKRQT